MRPSGRRLGSSIVVIPVHRKPPLRNTFDDGSGIGIRRDEAIEVGLSQHQQLAVAQRHNVGLARPARQQRHFAEKFTGSKAHASRRRPDLDRTCDKKDSVAAAASTDDAFVRHREARSQQLHHAIELDIVQRRKKVESFDQATRVQTHVKARARFGGAHSGNTALQILKKLRRDQPFLKQSLVSPGFLAYGRSAQKSDLESRDMVGVLPLQGVKRATQFSTPAFNDLAGELGNALAKNRPQQLAVESQKPVGEQSRHQQQFNAICQPVGEQSSNAEMPVKGIATRNATGNDRIASAAL
jgi:hypothetical protein